MALTSSPPIMPDPTSREENSPLATSEVGAGPQVVIKRGRGRPRKYAVGEGPPPKPKFILPDGTPRKRGRPRKVPRAEGEVTPPLSSPNPVPAPTAQELAVTLDEDEIKAVGPYALRRSPSKRVLEMRKAYEESEEEEEEEGEHKEEKAYQATPTKDLLSSYLGGVETPSKRARVQESTPSTSAVRLPPAAPTDSQQSTPVKRGRPPKNKAASPEKAAPTQLGSKLLQPTSSDAYFFYASSRKARGGGMPISTSTNTISSRLNPLEPGSLTGVVAGMTKKGSVADRSVRLYKKGMLPIYEAQLMAGYSICFHGVGSKLPVLLELLKQKADQGEGAGVLVQGSMKGLRIEDVLTEIETATGIEAGSRLRADDTSSALMARAQRIASFFEDEQPTEDMPPRLFLLLVSFDAPALQAVRFRPILELLCSASRIHVLACVEHVNSGMIQLPKRWLWQNMTTYVPPLDEMLLSRTIPLPASLDLHGTGLAPTTAEAGEISEKAARHILASVTVKARALFALLAKKAPISLDDLLDLSRRNFLASTQADLRQLLVEFTDHGLVRTSEEDEIYIAMSEASLQRCTLQSR